MSINQGGATWLHIPSVNQDTEHPQNSSILWSADSFTSAGAMVRLDEQVIDSSTTLPSFRHGHLRWPHVSSSGDDKNKLLSSASLEVSAGSTLGSAARGTVGAPFIPILHSSGTFCHIEYHSSRFADKLASTMNVLVHLHATPASVYP